jgi:hypothetical protein
MKTTTALSGQTLFDIAIQELGGIETVFALLDENPGLQLDLSVPAGIVVNVPDAMVNKRIAAYFAENNLHPVSGIGEELVITQDDMNNIKQDLNYDLSQGDKEFGSVQLFFLRDLLTVQISYSDLSQDSVVFSIDQSLDGESWSEVPYCSYVLDPEKEVHIFNIVGVLTNFVRGHIQTPDATTGTINHIIWKT